MNRKLKRNIKKFLFLYFMIIALLAGIFFGLFYYYSFELPPLSELQRFDMKIGSEVYDRNDNLIKIFSFERRKLVDLQELPDYLIDGLIATEDKNFYGHWGMDLKRFIKALLIDIQRRDFSQGASTITQQLARNMFLTLDKQIPRKIKEAILAVQIEKHYSKDEILEFYFNKSPFGPGLYGIEIAANKYFHKSAKDVTIPEAALLIGMPQLPSAYYPFRYPRRALKRRNIVLGRMLAEKVITQAEYDSAYVDSLELYQPGGDKSSADYFIEYIRQKLERKYGTTQLFTEGLKIYTTLDLELQRYADSILNKNLMKFERKNDYEIKYADFPGDTVNIVTPYVQGGVFSIEPKTGYVRVMIGGRNFNHSKFNRIMQAKRQPGSSFKPILYTTALVNGYTPATVIKDEKLSFIQCDTLFYKAHNYSRENFGYIRMRYGLKKSINNFAIKTIYDVGPEKVVDFARRFGLTTRINPFFTLAIGSSEVIPYELISAYTTFPNVGKRVNPIFIRRVEDKDGHILETTYPEKIQVIDEKTAFLITSMLESVVDEGTGVGIRWQPEGGSYRWNAGGKTGTTDDFRDAWFIGFNKKLVTGIWVGFDDFSKLGNKQSGAIAALPSWPYIMKKAVEIDSPKNHQGEPIIDSSIFNFDRPEGIIKIEISKETGLLPKSNFEETIEEYFLAGTQPTPLSDSLKYNFLPTLYRENEKDSLVIDLGGRRYIYPDSIIYIETHPDSSNPDYVEMAPRHEPDPIDLSGAQLIKNREVVIRPDSLLTNPFPLEKYKLFEEFR